ncbi:4-(cytidine 5'-diphospho)-2-C-methyl-D-erythritol kinase [Acetobacteraceae bacterium H6797]|nr:4-(cytidine 5'-diphospho)-2-C-methyl-D-erythritol kinase [Acetobacteraceae bacterium H6797]
MAGAERAPAKVNLHLHVTGRRADGYHLLDSLVVFADAADLLAPLPGGEAPFGTPLRLEGPEAAALAEEPDNLVLRTARALASEAGIAPSLGLLLEKNLPVASGIGGGSADAAAALRLLDRHWGTGLGEDRLRDIGAGLGADVPVCLASRPAVMRGIGEVLLPAPGLPACGLVLANPRLPVATPAVFKARQGGFTPEAALPASWASAEAMAAALARLRNDLEAPAIGLCPAIGEVLTALRGLDGCLLARMSGSGATCFGLFPSPTQAVSAAENLPSSWWRWGGGLYEPGS